MSRYEDPTDAYVRRLPLVSDEQVRRRSDRAAEQALFQEITQMPVDPTEPSTPTSRPRIPRRSVVLVATLASLSLAAIAGAVAIFSATSTSVGCHTPDGGVSIADAVTGDPVVDCARVWQQQTGSEPPALVAYDNASGGIEVVPAGQQVPDGWRPLAPGVAQDPAVIELEAALGDVAEGLNADCYPLDDARPLVAGELARLGLAQWTVVAERGEADGTTTCTSSYVEAGKRQVVLIPLDAGVVSQEDAPYAVLARQLHQALDDACLVLGDAGTLARQLGVDAGFRGTELVVHEVADPGAACARAAVNVGGRVEVTLRGPDA